MIKKKDFKEHSRFLERKAKAAAVKIPKPKIELVPVSRDEYVDYLEDKIIMLEEKLKAKKGGLFENIGSYYKVNTTTETF